MRYIQHYDFANNRMVDRVELTIEEHEKLTRCEEIVRLIESMSYIRIFPPDENCAYWLINYKYQDYRSDTLLAAVRLAAGEEKK